VDEQRSTSLCAAAQLLLLQDRRVSSVVVALQGHEADLSTQRTQAKQEARLPPPDGYPSRPSHYQSSSSTRAHPALGLTVGQQKLDLIDKVKGRKAFADLRRSRRRAARGAVRISFVGDSRYEFPCFAFALSRKTGGAVQRNRIRRRLRAIAEELAPQFPPGAYLINASLEAQAMPYGELRANVSAAVAAIIRQEAR